MKKLILVSLMLLSYASLAGTHAAKFYNNWTGSGTLVDPLTYDPPYWRPDLITPFLSSWALTNKITPASTHVVTSIAQSEPRDPYQGAVALPNGTALLIPCCSSYFGIVDQSGNYSHGAAAPAPVSYDFYGGIYVSNLNIVVCVPYNTANVWRYNVKDGTLTQGASHLFGVNKSLFNGGCMAPNGKVIFAPFQSSYVGVYDPVLDTYSNGPATPASHCYAAASVMTNGLVIFTPAGYNNIGIYDPVNNTLVNGPHLAGNGWATDGYQYVGSCNTIDGRIAMSSASPHTVGLILYGPDTNTFVKLGSATTGGGCRQYDF